MSRLAAMASEMGLCYDSRSMPSLGARALLLLTTLMVALGCGDDPSEGPLRALPGDPDGPAVGAIPALVYAPAAEDFTDGHPELPGMRLSFNTALVVVDPEISAGTVNGLLGELDATIVGGLPGLPRRAGGFLALKLPSASHPAMEQALLSLRASPAVELATQDILLDVAALTDDSAAAVDARWIWNTGSVAGDPDSGTWGMVAARLPQAWNLNRQLRLTAPVVRTGVLDVGFEYQHEDLAGRFDMVGTPRRAAHGTGVAGVIGAGFDDGKGVDGVNPFTRLVLAATPSASASELISLGGAAWGLFELIRDGAGLRVVNLSLGYNWSKASPPISTERDAAARRRADQDGELIARELILLHDLISGLPVIVSAGGNDHQVSPADTAEYASPFNNAALRQGAAAIIVVEADRAMRVGESVSYARAAASNPGGHLSAPGERVGILRGLSPHDYAVDSGSSLAAPYVSGVAGLLYALEPGLAAAEPGANVLKDLLVRSANGGPSRGGQRQLDAFAAALELDTHTGSRRVLRRMLDVDDGTQDGNTRIDPESGAPELSDDAAASGGNVDMADFRRWRDWLLDVEYAGVHALNGAPDHAKRDVNGDGRVDQGRPDLEGFFPQGDFNGDGRLSKTARAVMPGSLAERGPMTDLEVLKVLFSDLDYEAEELDGLVESGDVHVLMADCTPRTGERAQATLRSVGDGAEKSIELTPGGDRIVFTAAVLSPPAPTAYELSAELRAANGDVRERFETSVTLSLGGDAVVRARCGSAPLSVVTTALPPATVGQAYSFALEAEGGVGGYGWDVASGQLPAGLSLQAVTGLISGTPTTSGRFSFTARVGSGTESAEQALELEVRSAESVNLLAVGPITFTEHFDGSVRSCVDWGVRFRQNAGLNFIEGQGNFVPAGSDCDSVQVGQLPQLPRVSLGANGSFSTSSQLGTSGTRLARFNGTFTEGTLTMVVTDVQLLEGGGETLNFTWEFAGPAQSFGP